MHATERSLSYLGGVAVGVLAAFSLWWGLVWAQLGVPTASSQWDAAALALKTELAGQSHGRRLLVVAGSSGDYGIRCSVLSVHTGVPCVNMAVHAGLGLRYALRQISGLVRPGDIVLLAFEYQAYGEHGAFDPVLADYVMARDPAYLRSLDVLDLTRFVVSVDGERVREGLVGLVATPFPTPLDTVGEFNTNGDDVRNDIGRRTPEMIAAVRSAAPVRDLIDDDIPTGFASNLLTSFVRWSHQRNVTVWATFPATAYFASYELDRTRMNVSRIVDMYRDLHVPVLERARDLMWPADSFYNTSYHLVSSAADQRSMGLAQSACRAAPWLRNQPPCSVVAAAILPLQTAQTRRRKDSVAVTGPTARSQTRAAPTSPRWATSVLNAH